MTFTTLPIAYRGCLLALMTVVLLFHLYGLTTILYTGSNRRLFFVSFIMTAVSFVLFQGMIMYQQEDLAAFDIPVYILVTALVLLMGFAMYLQYSNFQWKKDNISNMSINEAFDDLPAGIAYSTNDGMPILVNEKMHSLSNKLFGEPVLDVNGFWNRLVSDRDDLEEGKDGQVKIKKLDDRVFSIQRNLIKVRDTDVVELIANDVSREYSLLNELEEKRNQLRIQNTRLKSIMGTIEYITMNRELLRLKTGLHDNIGQSILIARRYIYDPDSVDRAWMLNFWEDNIRHLIDDEPQEWELPYYVISREADRMGIALDIVGNLPEEKELIPVVDAAISVMIGNTLKHTDSKNVTVSSRLEEGYYMITLTNSGKSTEEKIVERGGLKNLRQEVEGVGGTMTITGIPEYAMELRLPMEVIDRGEQYGA